MRHQTNFKTTTVVSLLSVVLFASFYEITVSRAQQQANPVSSIIQTQPTKAAEPLRQTFTVDGQERLALVFKNTAVAPETGAPLVFAFHGHGGTMRHSASRFNIHTNWPEALVIYPQGLNAPGKYDPEGKKPGWQKAPGELGDRDLKFFDAMLEWAKKSYKIDAKRVYATGHSNGGGFTYLLWARRGETLAAIAPSAAGFGRYVRDSQPKPKPALLLAGEKDEVVLFANQQRSHNLVRSLNQCEATGSDFGNGMKLHKSKVAADTVLFIHPGGHELPPNFGELVTKFFKTYKQQ